MALNRAARAAEPGMDDELGPQALSFRAVLVPALTLAVALAVAWHATPSFATSTFAAQTGKECAYCHVIPGGPLTPEGQAFRAAGDVIPDGTTGNTTSTSAGAAPGTNGSANSPGPLLPLPDWLHDLLVWAHLVAMTTWLGAIIFVHVVQTPHIAGQGIPRGYLRLAWPAIGTLGVSGGMLTLGMIPSLSALTAGRWGLLLLAKIGIFLLLVTVATVATFVVSPRLRRLAEGSESGGEHQGHQAAGRVTVGYQGKVYDLSSSRLWKSGRHARRHEAWQDLTSALGGAPHGPEVFETFPCLSGMPGRIPRPVRAFILMAYGNLFLVLAVLLIVAVW
ncbi:MAG: CopD family protein [Thermoleophilia bacterium]